MDVALSTLWKVVIDDYFDAFKVDSSSKYFSADEQPNVAPLKSIDDTLSLNLWPFTVDNIDSQIIIDFLELLEKFLSTLNALYKE